ncbi:MAG: T9SS type A sorting domain-containing protein [Flavobacteriales bacterium]
MNKRMLLAFILAISLQTGRSQAPAILWQKPLGGSMMDDLRDVRAAPDGGFILAGVSTSSDGDLSGNQGLYDAWIIRTDSLGSIVWQRSFGGSDYDGVNAVVPTADGGFAAAGYANSNDGDVTGQHGGGDGWVLKLDGAGTLLWQVALGGTLADNFFDLEQTSDGGFIVVGESESNDGEVVGGHGLYDVWLVKLDSNGAIQWQKPRGGSGTDRGRSVRTLPGGNYVFAGQTGSNNGDVTDLQGFWDAWVVEVDSTGEIVWERTLGGSSTDGAGSICLTADGGSIMVGHASSNDEDVSGNHGGQDAWAVKLDNNGAIQWQRCLGGSLTEEATAVREVDDGYMVSAMTYSNDGDVTGMHGGFDAWVVMLDDNGDLVWQKAMGGNVGERANVVLPLTNGRLLVAGYAGSNNGDLTWSHGMQDGWLVVLGDSALATSVVDPTFPHLLVHPNPATDRLNVLATNLPYGASVELLDALGRSTLSAHMTSEPLALDVGALPRGLYTLRIRWTAGSLCRLVVVE